MSMSVQTLDWLSVNVNLIYRHAGILEVHDGIGDADVQLQDRVLNVERSSQTIGQMKKTF